MVEFDVKIKAQDLYDYLLVHTYNSSAGIVGSTAGGLLVVIALMRNEWALLAAGIVLLCYLPFSLYGKSRRQVLSNPSFQKPLHYCLDDNGITVSQAGETTNQPWDAMVKAISTTRSIIVYTSKTSAVIFPKRETAEQTAALIEVISTHMPPSKVKIKA